MDTCLKPLFNIFLFFFNDFSSLFTTYYNKWVRGIIKVYI